MTSLGVRAVQVLCLLLSMTMAALAQDAAGRGPVAGIFVDDSTRSIRPIVGTPGSAYADAAKVSNTDFALPAPDGSNALVLKDGTLSVVRRLDGVTPVWRELTSDPVNLSSAAWSENSDSLALFIGDAQRLDLWKSVSNDPKRAGSVDLTTISDSIRALAVDNSARYAFALTQGTNGSSLYLLQPDQTPRVVMSLNKAGEMLLAGNKLYVTDRERSEVYRVSNWEQTPSIETLAGTGAGVKDPVGVALSADGRMLYVANGEDKQVLAFDLDSNALKSTVTLDFPPTRLEKLGRGSLFLLDKGVPGEQPAQVLSGDSMQVFYVPVSAAAASASIE